MKSITLLIACFVSLSVSAQAFKFKKETIDYGKIAKNSNGVRVFKFTNIGKTPLIIKNVTSSCGCTIPEKPKKPIMPGKEGEIKVSYDTARLGGFSKVITIFSNAKNKVKTIKIKGYVAKKLTPKKEKSLSSK